MRNSQTDWTYGEIVPILERLGFVDESGDSTSHRFWHHPLKVTVGFVDPGHGPVKDVYIKEFLAAIDHYGIDGDPSHGRTANE